MLLFLLQITKRTLKGVVSNHARKAKLPGLPCCLGIWFQRMELHSWVIIMTPCSKIRVLVRMLFMYFLKDGIIVHVSTNGSLTVNCPTNSFNLPYSFSFLWFFKTLWNEILGWHTLSRGGGITSSISFSGFDDIRRF